MIGYWFIKEMGNRQTLLIIKRTLGTILTDVYLIND